MYQHKTKKVAVTKHNCELFHESSACLDSTEEKKRIIYRLNRNFKSVKAKLEKSWVIR